MCFFCQFNNLKFLRPQDSEQSRFRFQFFYKELINFSKKNFFSQVTETCIPQCPLECTTQKFTYSASSYELFGDSFLHDIQSRSNLSADFSNRTLNSDTAKQSVVRVNIFYDSLSYIISTESPQWTIISLIATIGGNLGLYLGMSLFTFSGVITTLIELVARKLKYNKVEAKNN